MLCKKKYVYGYVCVFIIVLSCGLPRQYREFDKRCHSQQNMLKHLNTCLKKRMNMKQ